MKRLIVLFLAAACLAGCSKIEVEDPDVLKAAVLSTSESVTAKNTLNLLKESTVATLTARKINGKGNLSDFDVIYIDKSVIQMSSFNPSAVEEFVNGGGCVFLDNEVYGSFSPEFIGASEFVEIGACPVDMRYPNTKDKTMQKIQTLLGDFCGLYKNYISYEQTLSQQYYGVGVIPSTAQVIAEQNGVGVYTLNNYGDGYVFFTNPVLPNNFSVNNLSEKDTGEALAITTVSANKLMRDYFAEFASLKKYGYAVERVFGSFASPSASWVMPIEDTDTLANGTAEILTEQCKLYGQIPSFTLSRNPYKKNYRAESVTYALNKDGVFSMDAYENAYSSGTHFVSNGEWLYIDCYENTTDCFEDSSEYIKRAYPCIVDFDCDGITDLICGSSDGCLYYYRGIGMDENYETEDAAVFTDIDGNKISVGAYSSPSMADMDMDGINEIISGSENGTIYCYKPIGGAVLEDMGVILETGLSDAMTATGDLNGDGITDLAVGSRTGEMRIYYGDIAEYGISYNNFVSVDSWHTWCAPCIGDLDGDGQNELYAGTGEGYIACYDKDNAFAGYIEGNECNYLGNIHMKFGTNSVPRIYDIDGDGKNDLAVGSLEYGMAVPIDSKYFPYKDEIKKLKESGVYVGVNMLSHEHADLFHDERELKYHKKAFEEYGFDFALSGVSQQDFFTSKIGYDTHYDNMRGYDGTYRQQKNAGLLWNSASKTPDSYANPLGSAENAIAIPFYLDNGLMMLEPSAVPYGKSYYAEISARYGAPLIFYNNIADEQEDILKRADNLVNDYGYNFAMENQLAKMVASAYNTFVNAKWENDGLSLSAECRDKENPFYDENYLDCVGVKIILADSVLSDEFGVDASVYYKKDNCIYVSLDKGARISKNGEHKEINITSVNLPAKITRSEDTATVKFLDGGMMSVTVKGSVRTTSEGWQTTIQDGKTVFTKYGDAQTLKIER